MSAADRKKLLCLFDVDGTLTKARKEIEKEMEDFMKNEVMPKCSVGLVGGSDLDKIVEQMKGKEVIQKYDYFFSENGLVAYRGGTLVGKESILNKLGEQNTQNLINFALGHMAGLELPAKRGTFVEFRTGLINLCPVGRSCSYEERLQFAKYDEEHGTRKAFKAELEKKFGHLGLQFALGGQISIDCFPSGWDKTYCLQFVEGQGHQEIHFFGDKTAAGGNDHEIFSDSRTVGHTVTEPEDTMAQLRELLASRG